MLTRWHKIGGQGWVERGRYYSTMAEGVNFGYGDGRTWDIYHLLIFRPFFFFFSFAPKSVDGFVDCRSKLPYN